MSNMSKKKKVRRKKSLASFRPEFIIGPIGTGKEIKGEEALQMIKKDIAHQEVRKNEVHENEVPKNEVRKDEVHEDEVPKDEVHKNEVRKNKVRKNKKAILSKGEAHNEVASHEEDVRAVVSPGEVHEAEVRHEVACEVSIKEEDVRAVVSPGEVHEAETRHEVACEVSIVKVREEDELKIRGTRIADSLLMQLEDEAIGFINRRLEEHVAKRIKGVLVPVAKLSLKMQKVRKKLTSDEGAKGDESASHLLDLEDDLDYILESSKLKRISPQVGERFNPNLHEEVDFSWNPDRAESEILATLRDGFFWEYNQEMVVKPQVVVNRRLLA